MSFLTYNRGLLVSLLRASLLLVSLLVVALPISAADKNPKTSVKVPLYQGITLGVELGGPVSRLVSNNWSTSANIDINLSNKYFPTFEVGRDVIHKTGETGVQFSSTGSYLKGGINIPIVSHGAHAQDLFYIGIHYGYSSFDYSLTNLSYSGGYWGQPTTLSLTNEHATAGWADIVAGVRVKIWGPFSMGWSIHYLTLLHLSNGEHSVPQYIPGYGQQVKPYSIIDAHLYYRLPF